MYSHGNHLNSSLFIHYVFSRVHGLSFTLLSERMSLDIHQVEISASRSKAPTL